jgi:hypothetical protein
MSAEVTKLTPGRRGRALWSVLLVLIFGLQLGLIVRTHVMRDDRYGFAMFHETIGYRLTYRWVHADGRRERFKIPDGVLRSRGKKLRAQRNITSVMGLGTVQMNVQAFARWLYENQRPDGVVGIHVEMRYGVNGGARTERADFVWPPEEAP